MRTTITFEEKVDGEYFTLAELNTLFTQIATVVNAKLDIDAAVLTDDAEFELSPLAINLKEAEDDDDAITVAQARALYS